MKKRFLAILSAAFVALAFVCGCDRAPLDFPHTKDGDPTNESYFEFTVTDDGLAYIIAAKADVTLPSRLIIPETYNEKDVIAIAPRGFAGRNEILSVVIPVTVAKTGAGAFADCDTLTEVVYGKNASRTEGVYNETQQIASDAFSGCVNLEKLTLTAVMKIGDRAFGGCVNLKSATVEETADVSANAFPSTVEIKRGI